MYKTLKFFPLVLLVLTTMPLSVFAMSTHHDTGEVIFWARDTFCSENETGYGFSCSNEKPFSCDKYRSDWNSNHNLQVSFLRFNKLLKTACEDEDGSMFSFVEYVEDDFTFEQIVSVKCLPGYKHPASNVYNFQFKCIEDPNYSEDYREEQYNKIMGLEQKKSTTQNSATTTKKTASTKATPSKAGGANQKKVVTPPKQTTDARAKANAEYAEQLREPWQEYEAHDAEKPVNTDAYAEYTDDDDFIQSDARAKANAEYAEQLREPWKEYEAHDAEKPVNTDAYAEYTGDDDNQSDARTKANEHIDKLSAPTTALAAPDIKSPNIKINEPTQLSDKDKKKMLEQQKKDTCENFVNGKYSVGECWCGINKVTDMTKTCQQINEEKQTQKDTDKSERDAKKQEKETKKAEEKAKKAEAEAKDKEKCENTIGGKYSVGACWCGTTKVTDHSKTCEQIKKEKSDKKDQAKIDKEAKDITAKANSLSIGDSLTYETALENELAVGEALSKWESKCEEKALALAGGAEYDITTTTSGNKTTLTCLIKNCTEDEYNVTTDKKSCTKNANGCADGDEKCSKKATKAENKLEKELEKDINTLSQEFLSVVKSITQTCENGGGSISENGECIVPETTETNGARANGRTAGAKSRKR